MAEIPKHTGPDILNAIAFLISVFMFSVSVATITPGNSNTKYTQKVMRF